MSRWLNSPVAVGVGTREIVVGARLPLLSRLRKPVAAAEPANVAIHEEQCCTEPGLLDALRTALVTTPATDAALAEQVKAPQRSASVVLDDFWGNHAILRGDFRTLRARELEEIVLAHFTDTYGIDGESLLVRFCVQRGGRALFASAMSRALHDGIREVSASARVRISRLRLGLPEMLNRAGPVADDGGEALLMFVAHELLQAVMIKQDRWVAYDAQRLFPGDAGDASRLAELAEQLFERSATRTSLRREDCRIYLSGIETDLAPFEARFAAAIRLAQPAMDRSPAHRLMEYAQ
ncbi:hypothetical protein P3T23_003671 [Paraburkholderia sp. GAS448]|uniref:hypothetical protein n=1 Tax=Paraburkholderia sp. GAS448 TaxID=3035136 RepID=UPI003D1D29D5